MLPLPRRTLQTWSWGGWRCRATSLSTCDVDKCGAELGGLLADALLQFCLVLICPHSERQEVDLRSNGARQLVDVSKERLAHPLFCASSEGTPPYSDHVEWRKMPGKNRGTLERMDARQQTGERWRGWIPGNKPGSAGEDAR